MGPGGFLLELVVCVLRTTRKESLQCQTLFWEGQKRIVSAYEVLPVWDCRDAVENVGFAVGWSFGSLATFLGLSEQF